MRQATSLPWYPRMRSALAFALLLALAVVPVAWGAEASGDPSAGTEEVLISNIYVDTFILEVLKDLAYQARVNIIPDSTVQGWVTLELEDVPFEDALRLVLTPGGYLWKKIGSMYLVGSADPASPLFHELAVSETIKLNYIKADEAKRLVGDFYARQARFDSTTNTVFVTGAPALVRSLISDLALLDKPPAQLMIEVLVTELNDEARQALGLELQTSGTLAGGGTLSLGSVKLTPNDGLAVTSRLGDATLAAKITALSATGKAKVKASPRLMVVEGNTASIFIGKDRYYRWSSTVGSTTTPRMDSINVGVNLRISPKVASDGNVTLLVEPSVSDVAGINVGDILPIVSRRQASTTVRVKNGETMALGGLIQEIEQSGGTRIPILGDLPLLRNLIGSSHKNKEQTEVIIFLTPTIVE